MNAPMTSTYDRLPYTSRSFPQTLPDRVGAIARVFGMTPTPGGAARVLEIGSASGGNLLPMAARWPQAQFVGIDLSARQIEDGRAIVAQLGLANVELRHMNLMDVDESFGRFDYIIAHGVYSWIPPAVQDKLLAICKHNLAPQGVAYVSYNTNPGWRMRGMIRDMMVYHTRQFSDVGVRVQQARALLDFLARFVTTENNDPYGLLLKREVETLRMMDDSYLAHEHLEEINEPLYFHQFAERASSHGLQYLGEAEFNTMLASNFPQEVADTLRNIAPNIVQMEQYMDFLRNRPFRQSLLVHQDVALNRNLDWRCVEGLYASSPLRAESATVDLRSTATERYTVTPGGTFVTPEPIAKAAMAVLAERWPQTIAISDLRTEARARLAALGDPITVVTAQDTEYVNSDMLRCFAAGLVELRLEPPSVTVAIGERPRAIALARLQAARGNIVTNLRHELVNLDELSRQLLCHLDGERDGAALRDALADLMAKEVLLIKQGDKVIRDPDEIRKVLDIALPQSLTRLARSGLLAA
ncbi:MAG: methyltransferase regulatory domain-containing protein [Burkholderiales bacterium]